MAPPSQELEPPANPERFKALGIKVSPALLAGADEVVE
jgi:hypothetical protein